jgi:hypothetical protein
VALRRARSWCHGLRLLAAIAAVTLTVGCSDSSSQTSAAGKTTSATKTAPSGSKGFGRGIYTTTGADYARIAELGFRTVIVDPATAALDEIDSHGLTAMIYLGGFDKDACTFGWTDAEVSQRVELVKDHPASGMYYIADEPHTRCPKVVQQIRGRSQLVKSIDPTARTAIAENKAESFATLANTTDVMILSIYPCSHPRGCVLSKIDAAMNHVRAANVKHPWAAPQSFGDNYYRVPSPKDLQAIIDRWRAEGVEGFFTYTWNCCGDPETLANHPELWDTWRRENDR